MALMQWGQYLDHDLTATALIHSSEGSLLDCSKCSDQAQDDPGNIQLLVIDKNKIAQTLNIESILRVF